LTIKTGHNKLAINTGYYLIQKNIIKRKTRLKKMVFRAAMLINSLDLTNSKLFCQVIFAVFLKKKSGGGP